MSCGEDIASIEQAERDRLNELERFEAWEHGHEDRLAMIRSVYRGITTFMRIDQIRQRVESTPPTVHGPSQEVKQFVLRTVLAAPFENDQPTHCFSLRFESEGDDQESLIVFMPEQPGFNMVTDDPEELEEPEIVYVAREDDQGNIWRLGISPDRAFLYIGANDRPEGQLVEGDNVASFLAIADKRVNEKLAALGAIKEDLANKNVVLQTKPVLETE
jgi:hypothetical protein